MEPAPVLNAEEILARLREKQASVNENGVHPIYAFYSSVLEGITTDPAFCSLPIDDHMSTRGHAVFDTANVCDGKAYGLSFHLDRMLRSAKKARIDIMQAKWLNGADESERKEELRDLVLRTMAASQKRNGVYCRFWLSAARGDFEVTPLNCGSHVNFYIVVHGEKSRSDKPNYADCTVTVPVKNQYLATLKSTNYLMNALCAMDAESETGASGSFGLQIGEDGYIAEFAISAILLLGSDGMLRSPVQDNILRSTTLERIIELVDEKLVSTKLVRGFEFAKLSVEDVLKSKEVMAASGGCCRCIGKFNGQNIGDGLPGVVCSAIQKFLAEDQVSGPYLDPIPYEKYV